MVTPADKPKFPGIDMLSAALQVHTTAVQKHIDVVNDVWSQVSSQDATLSSFTHGFSKLLHVWTDNTKDLWNLYSGELHATATSGCADLVFLLDKNAESSGSFQRVSVPPMLDLHKVVSTPLLTATDVPLDARTNPPQHVTWMPESPGVLKVAIAGLSGVPGTSKTGTYTAVIYDASQTPACALATIRLTFLG